MAGIDRRDGRATGRRLTPTRVASWLHPGVRRVAATIPGRCAEWDRHNAAQAGHGPLWLALGDSSALGIGASSFGTTALSVAHRSLCARTGQAWRLVNLGEYGVRLGAVVRNQLPRLHEWGVPDLVTVGAGSNDVAWSFGLSGLLADFEALLDGIPSGTVVATVPPGWFGKGLRVNDWLRVEAARRNLRVAEVGVFPDLGRMLADDGFHPNDAGYRYIAEGVLAALDR